MRIGSNDLFRNRSYAQQASFTAIHPARYFVKNGRGDYEEVACSKKIRTLQRKLISWLNRNYNDNLRALDGKPKKQIKNETTNDKSMRERLVKFFMNRDSDYNQRRVVRSFYTTNSLREQEAYILTGNSIDIVDEAAKPIGQIRRELNSRKEYIKSYYKISDKEAQKYLSAEDIMAETRVGWAYHDTVKRTIREILSIFNPNNSHFDAYFESEQKGNSIIYKLVDAKFNGR
ncbi:hypothetical protein HDR58_09305 [bacterium]|nr:hypothetical protein [bacterium]